MKTIIKLFICLSLIYTPYFAFAAAAEKWTIQEVTYNNVGKTLSYTAEKNYGSAANDYKYKAKVPVTASVTGSTAASMIRYGLASAALIALIEGVGWVIENGAVVKKGDPLGVPLQIYIEAPTYGFTSARTFSSKDAAVSAFLNVYLGHSNFSIKSHIKHSSQKLANGSDRVVYTSPYTHGANNTSATTRVLIVIHGDAVPETTPVSDTELGEAIIDSPSAPQIIPDIYSPNNPVPRPSPAPDATETALENAPPIPKTDPKGDSKKKPNKDTDGDGEPDTYDETLPDNGSEFQLPPACEWIPVVCEWYVEYKQDVKKAEAHAQETKSFWQSVKDWFDWTKDDFDLPEPEPNEILEIEPPQLNENAISWNSSCPADVSIPISLQGVSSTLVFSWSPWCQLLSIIKPAIVASAYIGAAFIVLGLRT